ncbi:MAG: glycosyltransferase [Acidobacteriota bacterium]
MNTPHVLYISGSLGLGHVTRDLAIAHQIRNRIPDADICWLAVHPASAVLERAGEHVLPEAADLANENAFAEESSRESGLNLLKYILASRNAWRQNVEVFARVVASRAFDLVIGDETYEINLALRHRPELKRWPFVMIFDFVGLDAMTRSPLERLGVHIWNRKWCRDYRLNRRPPYDLGLFIGEPEDVPDQPFGFGLPNRRAFATAMYTFVGYVFPFDPADLADRPSLRRELGYGPAPLVVVSIGGTSIGKDLLVLCGAAFRIARATIPTLHMVLVAGPRLATGGLPLPPEVEVRAFVPDLYKHFAVCDLAVVQGGATSTLELTALGRPFIYIPLEGHSEQAGVARILRRRGAGVEMKRSATSPAMLAKVVVDMVGADVNCPRIPTDGAHRAARHIVELMQRRSPE